MALQAIKDFHHRLCNTRVSDPACGTGNFLYVSLELMKRLEGEVLDALEDLGENPRLAMKGETVSPHQFHGLELNPRAVAIADLVLWIGYLKWQLRTVKADQIGGCRRALRFVLPLPYSGAYSMPKPADPNGEPCDRRTGSRKQNRRSPPPARRPLP